LHLAGYAGMDLDQIKRFRELGAHTHGHPEYAPQHGIEVTTGPLGQGVANGVGMAVAEAWLNARFGSGIIDHRTYVVVGDGCLMEGVAQEAISLAGHLRLGKLCVLWDDNEMTDDGTTAIAISEDVRARFVAAGWQVIDVDGHDVDAVSAALSAAESDPRPSLLACRTIIGRGLPRLEGQRGAHGGRVFETDLVEARRAAGWTHGIFEVPDEVAHAWQAGVAGRNADAYGDWQKRVAGLPAAERAALSRFATGVLPAEGLAPLRDYRQRQVSAPEPQPTNKVTADLVALLADANPELFCGAADLEGPTNCKGSLSAFTADHRAGRYLHYGVREHAMGAMMNGIVAHGGLVPLGATYLVFSDYMRPALRMAALMQLPVITIYSHDSIGIGKNGPTHQPVEFLAALRAIPGMAVFRPADAVEAAECWELALARRDGPSSMVCSRQALRPLRSDATENRCAAGAYVLREALGARRVTLLATGSEVAIACAARDLLQQRNIPTAVVSMPCWELFEQQSEAERMSVLGRNSVRIGIEAAVRQGWDRWIGEQGDFVGMSGFGASGPGEALFRHFGITAEAVVAAALARLPPG
jgi:transketolase